GHPHVPRRDVETCVERETRCSLDGADFRAVPADGNSSEFERRFFTPLDRAKPRCRRREFRLQRRYFLRQDGALVLPSSRRIVTLAAWKYEREPANPECQHRKPERPLVCGRAHDEPRRCDE